MGNSVLTQEFPAIMKLSKTEYESLQAIADAYGYKNIDAAINVILHRSICAELEIAVPNGPKQERLHKRINDEWSAVFKEAE